MICLMKSLNILLIEVFNKKERVFKIMALLLKEMGK
jgi:hypothetical protein